MNTCRWLYKISIHIIYSQVILFLPVLSWSAQFKMHLCFLDLASKETISDLFWYDIHMWLNSDPSIPVKLVWCSICSLPRMILSRMNHISPLSLVMITLEVSEICWISRITEFSGLLTVLVSLPANSFLSVGAWNTITVPVIVPIQIMLRTGQMVLTSFLPQRPRNDWKE